MMSEWALTLLQTFPFLWFIISFLFNIKKAHVLIPLLPVALSLIFKKNNFAGNKLNFSGRSDDNRLICIKHPCWRTFVLHRSNLKKFKWDFTLTEWLFFCLHRDTHEASRPAKAITMSLKKKEKNKSLHTNQTNLEKGQRGAENRCLLLVVVFAVKFPFSEVTAGGERLLTHGALQTLLVPRRIVDPHQEAVGDGTLASFTHGRMMTVGPWETNKKRQRS